jgi:Ca2+-dependent lipid-binding protein
VYVLSTDGKANKEITIYKNKIDAVKKTGCIGIYVKKSKYLDITKNTVKAKSYAVYISGSSMVEVGHRNAGNKLTTTARYGVYATGKSKRGITVQYNTITAKKEAVHPSKGSKVSASGNANKLVGATVQSGKISRKTQVSSAKKKTTR